MQYMMPDEAHQIAARLATASELFPLVRQDDWDAVVHTTAENDVITIVVTEHKSQAKREYRAAVQLIAETPTAPVAPGAPTPGESRCEPPTTRKEVH